MSSSPKSYWYQDKKPEVGNIVMYLPWSTIYPSTPRDIPPVGQVGRFFKGTSRRWYAEVYCDDTLAHYVWPLDGLMFLSDD